MYTQIHLYNLPLKSINCLNHTNLIQHIHISNFIKRRICLSKRLQHTHILLQKQATFFSEGVGVWGEALNILTKLQDYIRMLKLQQEVRTLTHMTDVQNVECRQQTVNAQVTHIQRICHLGCYNVSL